MARLLIVEDEPNARSALGEVFADEYETVMVEDVAQAEAALAERSFDLVLTDILMPGDRDGLDLLESIKHRDPDLPVLVMTAYGSVEKAVRAMREGAHDFLEKPLNLRQLRQVVRSTLEGRRGREATAPLRSGLAEGEPPEGFVGEAPAIRALFRVVSKAAPTNATVLLLGESGTGKELVAAAVHRASPRADGPFVKVNCAALPEGLLESELFGHVKGSFTGAVEDRAGRFEAANGGTLFLDEVGEIPLHTQVKLLRALQAREIERVGETKARPVDVRLIAATNADLERMVQKGTFRDDFYFRIKVVTIRMPSLRDRASDIPLLADHFRKLYAERHGRRIDHIDAKALDVLMQYDWPGNVRELENVIEAAVVLSDGDSISAEVLPAELGGGQRIEDLPERDGILIPAGTALPDAERAIILDTLERTGGNKTAAARILGIGLRTLYRKLESYEDTSPRSDTGSAP